MFLRLYTISLFALVLVAPRAALSATTDKSTDHAGPVSTATGSSPESSRDKNDECTENPDSIECVERSIEGFRKFYTDLEKQKMPVGVADDAEVEADFNQLIRKLGSELGISYEDIKKMKDLEVKFFEVPMGTPDQAKKEKAIQDEIVEKLTKIMNDRNISSSDRKRKAFQDAINVKFGYNNMKKNSGEAAKDSSSIFFIDYDPTKPQISSIKIQKPKGNPNGDSTSADGLESVQDKTRIAKPTVKPQAGPSASMVKPQEPPHTPNSIGSLLGGAIGGIFGGTPGGVAGAIVGSQIPGGTQTPSVNPSTIGPTVNRPFGVDAFASNTQPSTNPVGPKPGDMPTQQERFPGAEAEEKVPESVAKAEEPKKEEAGQSESTPEVAKTETPRQELCPDCAEDQPAGTVKPDSRTASQDRGVQGVQQTAGMNPGTGSNPSFMDSVNGALGNLRQGLGSLFSGLTGSSPTGHSADKSSVQSDTSDRAAEVSGFNPQVQGAGSVYRPTKTAPVYNSDITRFAENVKASDSRNGFTPNFFRSRALPDVTELNETGALGVGTLPDVDNVIRGGNAEITVTNEVQGVSLQGNRPARQPGSYDVGQGLYGPNQNIAPVNAAAYANPYERTVSRRVPSTFGRKAFTNVTNPVPPKFEGEEYVAPQPVKTEPAKRKITKKGPESPEEEYYAEQTVITPKASKLAKAAALPTPIDLETGELIRGLASARESATDRDYLESSGLPKVITGEVPSDTSLQPGVLPLAPALSILGVNTGATQVLPKAATGIWKMLLDIQQKLPKSVVTTGN